MEEGGNLPNRPTNQKRYKKRLEFLRREKLCQRQTYKPKDTPKVTREFLRGRRPAEGRPTNQKRYQKRLEFLRREEACQRQAYKQQDQRTLWSLSASKTQKIKRHK